MDGIWIVCSYYVCETRFEHWLKMQRDNDANNNNQPPVDPHAGYRIACQNGHDQRVCPGTVQRMLRTDTPCHYGFCGGKNKCPCEYTCATPCGGQCGCVWRE